MFDDEFAYLCVGDSYLIGEDPHRGRGLAEGPAGAPIGPPETEDRPATPPKVPSGDTTSEDESTPAVSHVSSIV